MRILIVDDSAMMRADDQARRRAGRACRSTRSSRPATAREALAAAREPRRATLLLTDINMPVMTGAELLREIARHEPLARPGPRHHLDRRIAARRDEAAELDVRCYLEKPFSPEVIRDVLTEAAGHVAESDGDRAALFDGGRARSPSGASSPMAEPCDDARVRRAATPARATGWSPPSGSRGAASPASVTCPLPDDARAHGCSTRSPGAIPASRAPTATRSTTWSASSRTWCAARG